MVTDAIADLLTRMRNAIMRSRKTVSVPHTKMVEAVVKIMKSNNIIDSFRVADTKQGDLDTKEIVIDLAYDEYENKTEPRITGLKRVSRPGVRIYRAYKDIAKVRSGYGISIISTPEGLMSDKDARNKKLGGEVLCEIW